MSLFINSPSYYTQIYGIDEEIYKMCRLLEKNIDIRNYTSELDSVGITPIIVPNEKLSDEKWKENKKVSLNYKFADIALHIDYSNYVSSDFSGKKALIIDNILNSLLLVKKRLKSKFDYQRIEEDIYLLIKNI